MIQKIVLYLLTAMLILLLVFHAFGLEVKDNFFAMAIDTEQWLGKTSEDLLKFYDKFSAFAVTIVEGAGSIYDATLGKFVAWIEESTGYSLLNIVLEGLQDVINFVREGSLTFEFFARNGIGFTGDYWDRFSLFAKCTHSANFYEDYANRKGFDWDKTEKYIAAIVDGELNEFSYELQTIEISIAKMWRKRFEQGADDMIWCSPNRLDASISDNLAGAPYYFSTVCMNYDDSFMKDFPDFDAFSRFYVLGGSLSFPITITNIKLYDSEMRGSPAIAFRFVRDNVIDAVSTTFCNGLTSENWNVEFQFYTFSENDAGELYIDGTKWISAAAVFGQMEIFEAKKNGTYAGDLLLNLTMYSLKDWYMYPQCISDTYN